MRIVWAPERDTVVLPPALFAPLAATQTPAGVAASGALYVTDPGNPARVWTVLHTLDLVAEATWTLDSTATSSGSRGAAAAPLTIVLGRRWMRRSVQGWAYDAPTRQWTVAALGDDDDGAPTGVRAVATLLGLVFAWLYSYWASELVVHLVPPPPRASDLQTLPDEDADLLRDVPWAARWSRVRPAIHTVLVLALSVPAHVLALVYAGTGLLVDATLADALHTFAVALAGSTLPLGMLLLVAGVLLAARRSTRDAWLPAEEAATRPGAWWRQCLLSALHAALVARALVACLLVSAGNSMLGLLVLALLVAVGLVYQGLYLVLLTVALSLAQPRAAWQHAVGPVWFLAALAQTAALIVAMIYAEQQVLEPLLLISNSYYPPEAVTAAALLFLAVLALAAVFVLLREVRGRLVMATEARAAHRRRQARRDQRARRGKPARRQRRRRHGGRETKKDT